MSLKELRNKSQESRKGGLAAMRTKDPQGENRKKEAEGGQWKQDVDPDDIRTAVLMAEFEKLPWYSKLGTAADDLVRSGASGITFGGLDKLLGPEAEAATRDAKLRSGWAGTGAEVGGMIASPVTRAIGAGAQLLRPAGRGLQKALTNLGVTASEGATLAATDAAINGNDIGESAATGAGLAAGAEATLKHALPKPMGILANLLSKVPYKDLADIYEIASKSSLGAKAVKDIQNNRAPVALIDEIDKTRGKLEGVPVPKTDEIEEALVDVFGRTTTSSGHKALDPQDQAMVNKLFDKAYTSKVDATTFNRNNLDDLAGYIEETRVPVAAEKSTGGMHVKNVHDTIKQVGSKASPEFKKLMEMFDTRKKAYTAGKATSTMSPNTRAFDTARDIGLATAVIGGSAALVNPVMLAGIIPMLMAASPKAVGMIARKSGSTKRNIKKVTGKGTGYGTLGLVPGMQEER
jgi:hypothetical protein